MDDDSLRFLINCAVSAVTYLIIDYITSPQPAVTVWWNYFTARAENVEDIEDEYNDL